MKPQPHIRAEVADSWMRSAAAGVDSDAREAPITLDTDSVREHREAHPLAQVFPLLDDVLGATARECDAVLAISDAAGQLLWVCGTPSVLRKAESIGFVEGSNWDERLAGTNAPGMVLTTGAPANIVGAEHFRSSVKQWSCAASPIHDPTDHTLLGVLDITGGDQIVVPQTMAMVRAGARMAEAELARDLLSRTAADPAGDRPDTQSRASLRLELHALGRAAALLTIHDGSATHTVKLSKRHSEIVVLLAATARGLSGDELAVLLYEDDVTTSTLRAELNRLRGLLGEDLLASRPYRLTADIAADWLGVEAHLAAGATTAALRAYKGPLLPGSQAPGITRLREALATSMRQAIIASGHADLMSAWTRSSWGADDYDVWSAQATALPASSPLHALVAGQLARLDREFGLARTEPGPPSPGRSAPRARPPW